MRGRGVGAAAYALSCSAARHSNAWQPGWDGAERRGGIRTAMRTGLLRPLLTCAQRRRGPCGRLGNGCRGGGEEGGRRECQEQWPGRVDDKATYRSIIETMMLFNAEINSSPKISPPFLCTSMAPPPLCSLNATRHRRFAARRH